MRIDWTENSIKLTPDKQYNAISKKFSFLEVVMRTSNFTSYLDYLWDLYSEYNYNGLSELLDNHVKIDIIHGGYESD
jgi:hypothetical protein